MDPLIERLKELGLVQANQVKARPEKESKKKLEGIIDGEVIENSQGKCYLVSSIYPWNYQHGDVVFQRKQDLSLIAAAGKTQAIQEKDISNLVFIDTETTGLSGGTGTFAFLVGLGSFTEDGFLLRQYIMRDPTEESALLLEISNIFTDYSGIVSFNGKAFDIPILKARYILNRMPIPFMDMSHLDLLFLSRKLWKNRLKSRALQDLEQEILNIPRTQEEVPGWMIPQIYFDYLRTGDPEPLKGVIYHNGMDIVSLAALFLHISNSFDQISNNERIHPIDYFSIGQVFFDLEFFDLAEKIFVNCIESADLPAEMHLASLKYTGTIYKKLNRMDQATKIWQEAASLDDIDAILELAKYFEHKVCDNATALTWTETAFTTLSKRGYHNYQDRRLKKEIEKRKDRLLHIAEKENKNV